MTDGPDPIRSIKRPLLSEYDIDRIDAATLDECAKKRMNKVIEDGGYTGLDGD